MSDYFRVVRGIELDEKVRILQGVGLPGTSADTAAAQVGSLYLETVTGIPYSKHSPASGTDKWTEITNSELGLFAGNPQAAVPPVADGPNSVALGSGAHTETTASNSLAIGDQALARHQGAIVEAGGRFGSAGDAQAGRYFLRTVTVNAFITELFLDGTNGVLRLDLPDDSTWTFSMTITGHRQDAGDGHAGYRVEGVVARGTGAATTRIIGATIKNVVAESNPAWDVAVAVDTTDGALSVTAKGESSKIIRWLAVVDTVEVTN